MATDPARTTNRVLLVEDAVDNQWIVKRALEGTVELTIASDLKEARRLLATGEFGLILLDVDLPDGSGFGLCSALTAEKGAKRPRVIFLTGSSETGDKLTGFSVGGDDYVTKPFDPLELRARVLSQLRTLNEMAETTQLLRVGRLEINLGAHSAECLHESGLFRLDLTPTEFRLLAALARHEGRILSREQLLSSLTAHGEDALDRTVDAHLSKLRRKLIPFELKIEAVYGIGYRLTKGETSAA